MILGRLTLENWLAFAGRFDLELPTGAIAVVGRYIEDSQRSNWSGKTALLEAIEWCLFGVHRKRYDDEVIFKDADRVSVELYLSEGIRVHRYRKRGRTTILVVEVEVFVPDTGEYKTERLEKKAAQAKIEELLRFDGTDYRATICFAQGDTEAIVEKTSGERRKIVGAWLELDAWLRVAARARVVVRGLADKHRDLRAELAAYQKTIEDAPDAEELASDIETARTTEVEARTALKTADTRLEAVATMEIARLDREKLAEVSKEGKALKAELTGATVEGLEEGRTELADLQAKASAAGAELRSAAELVGGSFDGTCPVTREECPVHDEVRSNRGAAVSRRERARSENQDAANAAVEKRRDIADLESQEREFDRKRGRFRSLVEQAHALKASAERYSETDELDEAAIQRLKFDRSRFRDAVATASAAVALAEKSAEDLRLYGETVTRIGIELEELTVELRIANLAARSVGPSGIPARIAEAQLEILEERANALLVGSGLSFTFAWDRVTKDLTKRCFECGYAFKGVKDKSCPACDAARGMKRADELEILVDDGSGAIEDVKVKSGGAKVLVASAIRLAAGAMLRDLRGSRCAWAQVDEPFGALDARNRRELVRTFSGMLGSVGLEQAFVVSHDSALLDGLPGRIEVVRSGDRSTVEVIR